MYYLKWGIISQAFLRNILPPSSWSKCNLSKKISTKHAAKGTRSPKRRFTLNGLQGICPRSADNVPWPAKHA
jgi:hypothetical protein